MAMTKNQASAAIANDDVPAPKPAYLEALTYVERLHRRLLDVIKDELDRIGCSEINSVQALLLFNIGDAEMTAGELRTRGHYLGSNVSYNLKKLVELGYVHHERCEMDRRAVRVRLTPAGQEVRDCVARLFARHAEGLELSGVLDDPPIEAVNLQWRRIERFWAEQIRYIY